MQRFTWFTLSVATLLAAVQAKSYAEEPLVLVQTIPLKGVAGKLDHLAVDRKGGRLFVANKPNNTLDIVDLKEGKLIKQIPDQGKVSGVAYASDLDTIYVGNGAGTCNGFDGKDYRLVFSTPAPNADNVHYHSGTKRVYVGQDELMSELDAKSGEVKAEIKLPGAVHGFRIDKDAGKIYTVLTKPNLIGVVDIAKQSVIESFQLTKSDAGSPIAQDAANGLLFVGCPKKQPMVVVFDAKMGKEIASVEIPGGIDDLHFDRRRNRLYASCSDQVLVVIENKSEKYEITQKIPTPKDSRTCVFAAGKLYLGVPRQENTEGPEVRVFEAHPVITENASAGGK
jgi:DNA-binding beta-propeller fold protein YncE